MAGRVKIRPLWGEPIFRRIYSIDLAARPARFLIEPGISVVNAALAAANIGEVVHATHDLTEGGLVTGLFELVAPAVSGFGSCARTFPYFAKPTQSALRSRSIR
jgi:hypothetical protein